MTTDTETTEAPVDPILHRATRLLPVKLTDDELRRLGHDLAQSAMTLAPKLSARTA